MKKLTTLLLLLFLTQISFSQEKLEVQGNEKIEGKLILKASPTDPSVFIGQGAGDLDDGNNNNVFIGNGAGVSNSSGGSNSFLGAGAGTSNTQGNANTFLGADAGAFNNTGIENTFVGMRAGTGNLGGGFNTFVGKDAGAGNLSGNNNTFIGRFAGVVSASGNNNAFLGFGAGSQNMTGSGNTFLGTESGFNNMEGHDNTYVGRNAGLGNLTGINNVMIGKDAGFTNTGSSNIFIGHSAGLNEMGSNKLYIENSDAATPLIWGDFTNGAEKVGINRVALSNTLEVGGTASKTTAGEWAGNSDARLKKNIQSLNSAQMLQKLLFLHGITYEWNDEVTGMKRPEGIQFGFTAQNIQAVFPTLVQEDQAGYLQTAYGTYDAMTVEAIRALNDKIAALEAANLAQQALIEQQRQQLAAQAATVETQVVLLQRITASLAGAGILIEK